MRPNGSPQRITEGIGWAANIQALVGFLLITSGLGIGWADNTEIEGYRGAAENLSACLMCHSVLGALVEVASHVGTQFRAGLVLRWMRCHGYVTSKEP